MAFFTTFDTSEIGEILVYGSGRDETAMSVPVVIMDGGMGTTLEDLFKQDISNTPLWSARIIRDNPDILKQAHLAFLRAGSQVFQTVTYQSSVETFAMAGYSEGVAIAAMREAVRISVQARQVYLDEQRGSSIGGTRNHNGSHLRSTTGPALCLSLGPYGAILPGAQEHDGLYPPPFGPVGADAPKDLHTTAFATSSEEECSQSVAALEERAELSLADFHLRRLLAFAEDDETWDRIDCIAFESVPLVREARAIKRAVSQLEARLVGETVQHDQRRMKPWYISCNFHGPNGECTQERWKGGPRIDIGTLVHDVLGSSARSQVSPVAQPAGIGINCAEPKFISRLVKAMTEVVAGLSDVDNRPWLIVYPNGGLVYNADTQTWHGESGQDTEKEWAKSTWESIQGGLGRALATKTARESQIRLPWSGVVVGGCCKVGPENIHALKVLSTTKNVRLATVPQDLLLPVTLSVAE
ncbi:AdoMet-homocysteine methyltransferase [Tulasnella sp. JGI-2019a]|nr:AdoMet-homocysteine methyltransferase [Tulasnella sp. JGI-2019a]